jgi:3-oxoacyl-[acyl-carrier protein] reductase
MSLSEPDISSNVSLSNVSGPSQNTRALTFYGKRALLIGGSCELALALARTLMDAGIFTLLTYRSSEGQQRIIDALESFEDRYQTFHLDFSQRESLNHLPEHIGNELDYSVDFVQGDFESLIAAADDDRILHYFEENIAFRALMIKAIVRIMLKHKKGRLIFVSSAAAERANAGQGFYAAAKLASESLYRNVGLELGRRGITTLSLRPGYIDAGRGRPFMEQHHQDISRKVPIQRALDISEIIQSLLFFLSDGAAGFNAVNITLDGGLAAGK